MSGAEVIAVLGIGASIIQVIDCGNRVLSRISEFRRNMAFQDIALQIPLLINDIKTLNSPQYRQLLDTATEQAMIRVLEGCLRQLNALDSLIRAMTPEKTASKLYRMWKGVWSFGKDTKLREIMGKLTEYKSTITLHLSTRHVQTPKTRDVFDGSTKSFFDVPMQRVSHFVGRTQILDSVNNAIATSTSNPAAVVLTGVGGQGKTQVALQFCQRYAETYRAIFWVNASSEASTARSFERIAVTLSTSNQIFPDSQAKIAFVKETLQTWPDPWLLVFDNYDSPRTFDDIKSFFPISNAKRKNVILVTSRIASSGRLGTLIKMDGLTEDEALELLFLRSHLIEKRHENRHEGRKIVKKLGYLPLAIDQAAAYIFIRQLPLKLFMQHYETRKEVILKHTPDSSWEYRSHTHEKASAMNLSVFTTWELSFEQIAEDEEERRRIGEFLTQSAFFDPTGISESLFTSFLQSFTATNSEPPSWIMPFLRSNAWDSSQFQDVVVGLMNLSLIQAVEYVGLELKFSMHPLIKDWLQLRKTSNPHQCVHTAITTIAYWILDRDVETLPLLNRQELLGHLDSCGDNSRHYLTSDDSVRLHGGFVDGSQTSFASFYGRHDRYTDAEKLFLKSLEWQNKELGPLDPGTLRTKNNLGAMYLDMGRLDKAADMLQQTLDAKLKVMGPKDPLTLDTVNNMGNLYVMQAMFGRATEMYTRALKGYIDIYGHSHRSVVEALNNLGEVSMKTGNFIDAESQFTAALDTASNTASERKNSFTSDGNALVLYIKSNIAVIYTLQGRHSEAIEVYKQVASGREKLLGPGHSLTLMSMCELADIYRDRGQTDEAELWYARGKATIPRRQERYLELIGLPALAKGLEDLPFQEYGHFPRTQRGSLMSHTVGPDVDPRAPNEGDLPQAIGHGNMPSQEVPFRSNSNKLSRTISQTSLSIRPEARDLPPDAEPPRLEDGIIEDQPREATVISGDSNQGAKGESRNGLLTAIHSHSTKIELHHGGSHVGAAFNNALDDQCVTGSHKMDDPEESLCRVGDSYDQSMTDRGGPGNHLLGHEKVFEKGLKTHGPFPKELPEKRQAIEKEPLELVGRDRDTISRTTTPNGTKDPKLHEEDLLQKEREYIEKEREEMEKEMLYLRLREEKKYRAAMYRDRHGINRAERCTVM